MTSWAEEYRTGFRAPAAFNTGDWPMLADAEAPASITEPEMRQIERANAIHRQPVIFVDGLWPSGVRWDHWIEAFEAAGFATLTPNWPSGSRSAGHANQDAGMVSDEIIARAADHFAGIAAGLYRCPAIIGHSMGGLFARILAGRGLSVATVAIDPAPLETLPHLSRAALKSNAATLQYATVRRPCGPSGRAQARFAPFGETMCANAAGVSATWDDVAIAALAFVQRFTS